VKEYGLAGSYDLHIHPAPSPFNRALDDIELLKEADKVGMAGIVLKSHYESTAARADLANKYAATQARAYGAIVLNHPVGGINPYAVQNALKRGAKLVFMPTRDAANSLTSGNMPGDFFDRPGISIVDRDGKLISCVSDVMDVVKQYDAALATGHLSPEESILLCKQGVKRGVRMVLTHPEFSRTKIDATTQRELAQMGVHIEKCWYNIGERECAPEEMAQAIRTVGAQHCFLSTDRGQQGREKPAQAMMRFLQALQMCGISEESLYEMTHETPRLVLNV
jgi:hypothetical protein